VVLLSVRPLHFRHCFIARCSSANLRLIPAASTKARFSSRVFLRPKKAQTRKKCATEAARQQSTADIFKGRQCFVVGSEPSAVVLLFFLVPAALFFVVNRRRKRQLVFFVKTENLKSSGKKQFKNRRLRSGSCLAGEFGPVKHGPHSTPQPAQPPTQREKRPQH
jgi:hypothetical protein